MVDIFKKKTVYGETNWQVDENEFELVSFFTFFMKSKPNQCQFIELKLKNEFQSKKMWCIAMSLN